MPYYKKLNYNITFSFTHVNIYLQQTEYQEAMVCIV